MWSWPTAWRVLVLAYGVYNLGGAPGAAEGWRDVFQPLGAGRVVGLVLLVALALSLLPEKRRRSGWLRVKRWIHVGDRVSPERSDADLPLTGQDAPGNAVGVSQAKDADRVAVTSKASADPVPLPRTEQSQPEVVTKGLIRYRREGRQLRGQVGNGTLVTVAAQWQGSPSQAVSDWEAKVADFLEQQGEAVLLQRFEAPIARHVLSSLLGQSASALLDPHKPARERVDIKIGRLSTMIRERQS